MDRRDGGASDGRVALAIVAPACLLAGCTTFPMGPFARPTNDEGGFFGWHMQAPFDTSEVKTIFVSFKSQRFRRDLQLMLEEAVTKEINMRTPYRIVGSPEKADAILSGMITVDDKNLIVERRPTCPARSARP